METLVWLRDYLESGVYAVLALSIVANVFQYRATMREKDAHLDTVRELVPLVQALKCWLKTAVRPSGNDGR